MAPRKRQSRGHGKAGGSRKAPPAKPFSLEVGSKSSKRMSKALSRLEEGKSYRQAAKKEHVSAERLRKVSQKFNLTPYPAPVGVPIQVTGELGRSMLVWVKGVDTPVYVNMSKAEASANGEYLGVVGRVVAGKKGAASNIRDFAGLGVKNRAGKFVEWETNVARLRQLSNKYPNASVYKLVGRK